MKDKEKSTTKRKKLKISRIVLLFFVIVVIVLIFYRINLRRKLDSRLKGIRAEGYPVTFDELNEWYSIPAGLENSAYIVLDAMDFYNEPNEINSLPVMSSAKLPNRTETMSQEMKKIISQFLSDNQKSLDLLHKTIDLENSCYPVDFSLGIGTRAPHINNMRRMAQLIQLEAVLASEEKKTDAAVKSIKSILGVAKSLNKEPITASQAICIACNGNAVTSFEYAMNRVAFSDEQLIELGKAFRKAENLNGILNSFLGERCVVLDILMHPSSFYFDQKAAVAFPPVLFAYKVLGVNERDATIFLDQVDEAMEVCNLPADKRLEAAKTLNEKIAGITAEHVLLHHTMPLFGNMIIVDLRSIARLELAQTVIAVQRYRLRNDRLPDSLDNLVPDYLETVPLDPFDGKELKYKKLEPGYIIYSIGDDQIDDGGKEQPEDKEKGTGNTWDITFIIEK
jgi:hypothetical protein